MIWSNYITGLWLFTYIFLTTNILIAQKKRNLFLTIGRIFLFAFLFTINTIFSEPLMEFIIYIFITLLFVFFEFPEKNRIYFRFYITIYIIRLSFEFLLALTLNFLKISFPSSNTILIMTSLLTLLLTFYFRKELKELIYNPRRTMEKRKKKNIIIHNLGLLLILFIRIPHFRQVFTIHSLMNLFLFFIIFNLAMFLFQEIEKREALNKNYKKIVEYSEFTEGLLTEYKSFAHEYKNKLLTIKGIADPKNKELQEYIDSILEEKGISNYRWLLELKNIPIAGAKGLINFKLCKMKELNIDVEVYISEEIAKLKENFLTNQEKNDLYTILGILLDNAIEASLESQDKMISLQLYKEEEEIVILLANTFKHIQLDHMEEKGVSSKGPNRGIGLYLLQNIIKHSNVFFKETSIFDNFFVQKISIRKENKKSSK